ncbi:hypothetical protein ACSVDM_01065 [Nocardia sp. JW2]|uniref:hypothetical protein n=1 Tax=Nocardia sp. JW2 TaxID=3450738 RepID=UPI003F42ABFE
MREFAVPPTMIDAATARRGVGDWAGACAAAHVDTDIDLRALARKHGRELAARVRTDLRYLAPDLLRWHLPRVAPDGLLRPGLTLALARYASETSYGRDGFVHLVVRTAPAWADAGQRISLAIWDGSDTGSSLHPHPRPNRRYRLDLHRHLWDARRAGELGMRCGASSGETGDPGVAARFVSGSTSPADRGLIEVPTNCAVEQWAAEAVRLLRAEQRPMTSHAEKGSAQPVSAGAARASSQRVLVRFGARRQVVLEVEPAPKASGEPAPGWGPIVRIVTDHPRGRLTALPILPDAATWTLPDLDLLRAGAITADRLHPLVAEALVPMAERSPTRTRTPPPRTHLVECRGETHRIGLVNGTLSALDHDPAEVEREELLVALTGVALPCLRVIDAAHRRPDWIDGVRERLDHGDTAGALAVVEELLGAGAVLRDGPLRDALDRAARRRITYGLYRSEIFAGLGKDAPRTLADRLQRAGLRHGRDRKLLQRLARHDNRHVLS